MLKTIGATLALAFVAATAGQALAHNLPHPVPRHVPIVHCPPAKGYARTCY